MATGFPVKANYATGDVLTAANMNDLSGTVNYLQYMPPRNSVLNSNFSVWQRGTSVAVATNTQAYTADRWNVISSGLNQAVTISRQATGDTTNLPNIQYCARVQRNSGQTGTSPIYFGQSFETVNSIPFVGKAVTLSLYARAGANYSGGALTVAVDTGTGTDQNILSGYTGSATPLSGSATLTTTWQRFTYTGTISSSATELGIRLNYTPVGTAGANDYFEVTGVQLELGSVANTYMPNQPTYQAELAACQRYYQRFAQTGSGSGDYPYGSGMGSGAGGTTVVAYIQFPVPMRTQVSSTIDYSGLDVLDGSNARITVTSVTMGQAGSTSAQVNATVASGITQYRPYFLNANNNNTGYIGFSAEL